MTLRKRVPVPVCRSAFAARYVNFFLDHRCYDIFVSKYMYIVLSDNELMPESETGKYLQWDFFCITIGIKVD
jgi:hypothetical protein